MHGMHDPHTRPALTLMLALLMALLTACTPDTWQERVKQAVENGEPVTAETFDLPLEDYTDPQQFDGPRLMFFGRSPWRLKYADKPHGLMLFSVKPDGSDLRLVLTEEELYKDSSRSSCCVDNNFRMARSPDNRYVAFVMRWRRDAPPEKVLGYYDGLWLVDLQTREFIFVDGFVTNLKFTHDSKMLCFFGGHFKCYDIPARKLIVRDDLKLNSKGFGFMDEDNKIVNINPRKIEIYSFEGKLLQTWPFTDMFENPKAKRLVTSARSSIVAENGHYAYIYLADMSGWFVDVRKGQGLAEFMDSVAPAVNVMLTNYGDAYWNRNSLNRKYGKGPLADRLPRLSDWVPAREEDGKNISNTLNYYAFKLINQ
ncbi:MAG: hypothetical protein D6758_08845 [Gammaproteobacteria bacterium]|nr:MAG: hypothetical protein D6758_08845 [Gammaproteobacteria bacterium]